MLRFVTLSAAGMLMSTAAMAADQLYYTPAPAEPAYTPFIYDWTGHYVGFQAGGGWGDVDADFVTTVPSAGTSSYDVDGGLLGAQIGANWQDQMVVWGVQADIAWADIGGGDGGANGATDTLDSNYLMAATGRVGLAIEQFHPYLLGGVALIDYDYELANLAGTATESHGATEFGGTLGAGLEVALSQNVSLFGEYRYYWFDGDSIAFAGPGAVASQTITPELGMNTLTAGINWKF